MTEDQDGDLSETERTVTGKILGSITMLSDKNLGRKRFSDALKKVGTVAARR